MTDDDLMSFSKKKIAPETNKKIQWVVNMYEQWKEYCNAVPGTDKILADLEDSTTLYPDSVNYTFCWFITEKCKLDGTNFPPCTLYEIAVYLQFK